MCWVLTTTTISQWIRYAHRFSRLSLRKLQSKETACLGERRTSTRCNHLYSLHLAAAKLVSYHLSLELNSAKAPSSAPEHAHNHHQESQVHKEGKETKS